MKGKKIVSTLLALLLLASLPVSAHAATWDIGKGDITVNAGSGGQTGGSSSSGGTSQPSGGGSEGQQIPDGMAENGGVILDITLQVPNSATYATAAPQSGDALRLWTMCAERGDPLDSVPSGEQVEIILTGRSWCLVQYGTVQGYCQTAYLEVVP